MSDPIGRARNARLNQALQHAVEIVELINKLTGTQKSKHIDQKDDWRDVRLRLADLTQCFHEANAYNNSHPKAKISEPTP